MFLYLMLGICSILAVVAAIVLLTSKINTLIFICASVIIFLFSILAYIFIGVFFASLWGKKIKGTIIKEIKDEKIVDGVIVEKYITQFAYINRDNKLIRDEVNKIYDCGFVPIRLLGNFKYIDSQLNFIGQ